MFLIRIIRIVDSLIFNCYQNMLSLLQDNIAHSSNVIIQLRFRYYIQRILFIS